MESYQTQPEEYHLFDENSHQLVQAGSGKRLGNYVVDRIVFYIFMYFVGYFMAFLRLGLTFTVSTDSMGLFLTNYLISALFYACFMGLTEFLMKGKTVGKLITGTRAVKQDGSPLRLQDAFLRGICRIIPLNGFSALGNVCYPWHDSLSKTFVIDEKESRILTL